VTDKLLCGDWLSESWIPEDCEPTRPSRKNDYLTPSSPTFFTDSPDYYPSEESRERSRSRSASPHRELKAALLQEEAKTEEVTRDLKDLRVRYERLRHRVIYLEGELAVYKRFAVIHSHEFKTPLPQFTYPPPPPPPRRV
jgi:hypothetical protein